jgi:hypothetical protein
MTTLRNTHSVRKVSTANAVQEKTHPPTQPWAIITGSSFITDVHVMTKRSIILAVTSTFIAMMMEAVRTFVT